MNTVNIHEAKTHLSRLVEQAARGESFVIAKAGKRVKPIRTGNFKIVIVERRFENARSVRVRDAK